jgi:hypothetical protein
MIKTQSAVLEFDVICLLFVRTGGDLMICDLILLLRALIWHVQKYRQRWYLLGPSHYLLFVKIQVFFTGINAGLLFVGACTLAPSVKSPETHMQP